MPSNLSNFKRGNDGTLADVEVTLVPPPTSGQSFITDTITVFNPNSTAATVVIALRHNNDVRIIAKQALNQDKTLILGDGEIAVCDTTQKRIVGYTTASVTTPLDFTVAYGEQKQAL